MTKRTFLVTGASKGIGRALSMRLADAGHHVVGVARDQDPSFPGTLESIDLSDSKASAGALSDLARRHSFDGAVNNLGLVRLHPLGEIDLKDVDDMLRVNLHPAIRTVQAILPTLQAKGWGRIVNPSSLTVVGVAQRTAYAAAKAAINSVTRTWALELAETGITVKLGGTRPGGNGDVPSERACRQRGRAPLPFAHPDAASRQAARDCRGHRLPALGGGRLHHRADPICRWWWIDRKGGHLSRTSLQGKQGHD